MAIHSSIIQTRVVDAGNRLPRHAPPTHTASSRLETTPKWPGCEIFHGSIISWTAETVEKFLPPFSVSNPEITKMLSQYSPVMMCVSTIMLLILAMVWGLHNCEFLVINKSCLLTCVSDTQRGGRKFSTVSAVQEICDQKQWLSEGLSRRRRCGLEPVQCARRHKDESRITSILRPARYRCMMVSLCGRYRIIKIEIFENSYDTGLA